MVDADDLALNWCQAISVHQGMCSGKTINIQHQIGRHTIIILMASPKTAVTPVR